MWTLCEHIWVQADVGFLWADMGTCGQIWTDLDSTCKNPPAAYKSPNLYKGSAYKGHRFAHKEPKAHPNVAKMHQNGTKTHQKYTWSAHSAVNVRDPEKDPVFLGPKNYVCVRALP